VLSLPVNTLPITLGHFQKDIIISFVTYMDTISSLE
jgi:hypothetical protein